MCVCVPDTLTGNVVVLCRLIPQRWPHIGVFPDLLCPGHMKDKATPCHGESIGGDGGLWVVCVCGGVRGMCGG